MCYPDSSLEADSTRQRYRLGGIPCAERYCYSWMRLCEQKGFNYHWKSFPDVYRKLLKG